MTQQIHGSDFFDTSVHSGPAVGAVTDGLNTNGKPVAIGVAPRLKADASGAVKGGPTNNGKVQSAPRKGPSEQIDGTQMPSSASRQAGLGNYNGSLLPSQKATNRPMGQPRHSGKRV